jgi:hypothetical protein
MMRADFGGICIQKQAGTFQLFLFQPLAKILACGQKNAEKSLGRILPK